MGWRIRGTYFESCNCDAICPCRRINGVPGGRSTHGVCMGVLSWLIDEGVARVPIQKDGMYHIASMEKGVEHGIGQDEDVRLTDDYFIEARKDSPPNVRITKPGRDAKARSRLSGRFVVRMNSTSTS